MLLSSVSYLRIIVLLDVSLVADTTDVKPSSFFPFHVVAYTSQGNRWSLTVLISVMSSCHGSRILVLGHHFGSATQGGQNSDRTVLLTHGRGRLGCFKSI